MQRIKQKKVMLLTFFNKRSLFILTVIVVAAITRLLPHPSNVTPIAAIALFGAASFSNKRLALILPLAAMFLSDLVIGFHNTIIYVYVSFIITSIIGLLIRNNVNYKTVIAGSLVSSVLFFLITNFGVWVASNSAGFPQSLLTTYELGLPFFRNEIIGTLLFNGVLFGSLHFAVSKLKIVEVK